MTNLTQALATLRRRWALVLAVPLAAILVSVGAALSAPPRYMASASLLVTRAEDRRFDTEDALAYDLPAIVRGEPFARELADMLAGGGHALAPEQVRAALAASNQRRVVTISAAAAEPALAEALLAGAVALVQRRGMALWGDAAATPERTGLNAVVLEGIPPHAAPAAGPRQLLLDAAARGLVGLGAGVALALLAEAGRRQPAAEGG